MSNQILSEVWQHAPKMNTSTRIVLLRMADKAADEHRMYWESLDTMADVTAINRSTVKRALQELYALHVLTDVPDEERPAKARGLPSACRRILPAETWGTEEPDSDTEGGLISRPLNEAGISTKSGEGGLILRPNTNNNLSSYGREKSTSYSSRRSELQRTRKPSRRQSEQARQAEVDALDPARSPEVLELFPVEPAEVDPVGNRSTRSREPRTRTNSPDSSMGLALGFRDAQAASDWRAIDMASLKPLAANFARWKSQGISPETIRKMIDIYAGDERIRSSEKTKAPWLDFVGKKHLLLNRVERSVAVTESADYWDRMAEATGDAPGDSDMWYVPGQIAEGVDK